MKRKVSLSLHFPLQCRLHRLIHAQEEVNTEDRLHKDNISIVERVGDLKKRGGKMKTLCRRS